MIKSFGDKETKKIFDGEVSKKFPANIQKRARRKIDSLYLMKDINDLKSPPSNHLEALSGDRLGQFSIRVNDKYRVCFEWINNCAKYGRLYDGNAAKKACPDGWHLPDNKEIEELCKAVDGLLDGACVYGGTKLKAKDGWKRGGNGTDDFGFSALPGGCGGDPNACDNLAGLFGYWWSASVPAFRWEMSFEDRWIKFDCCYAYDVSSLFSVRCVNDK